MSSSSSFPSISMGLGGSNSGPTSSSFIRLSPTAFFNSVSVGSRDSTPTSASSLINSLMNGSGSKQESVAAVKKKEVSPSPVQLISTPKSHHRRVVGGRQTNSGSSVNCARKKLCYPEEGALHTPSLFQIGQNPRSNRAQTVSVTPRNVCFIPNFIQPKANQNAEAKLAKGMRKNASLVDSLVPSGGQSSGNSNNQCQSAPVSQQMFDNFSSTNVYATPPRHSLRRQQSASATLVSVGNGRFVPSGYRGNTAFVRFTPPIGEDVSAIYAGSKFSDSPSAKHLPMPPSQWLDEVGSRTNATSLKSSRSPIVQSSSCDEAEHLAEEEEATSDDTGVVFDLDDGKCSSPSGASDSSMIVPTTEEEEEDGSVTGDVHDQKSRKELNESKSEGCIQGVRLHPLQLIAAVAAS